MPSPGALNLIADVSGILVGHATDDKAVSGVMVMSCKQALKAAVDGVAARLSHQSVGLRLTTDCPTRTIARGVFEA